LQKVYLIQYSQAASEVKNDLEGQMLFQYSNYFQLCYSVWHYDGLKHAGWSLVGYYATYSGK